MVARLGRTGSRRRGRAGRLAVGYRADLSVLADNPLCVPDGDLAGLPVLLTVLGGRVTHRAPGL